MKRVCVRKLLIATVTTSKGKGKGKRAFV